MSSSETRLGPKLLSAPLPRELPAPLKEVAAALRPVVRALLKGDPLTSGSGFVTVDVCLDGSCEICCWLRPGEVWLPRPEKFDKGVPAPLDLAVACGASPRCMVSRGDALLSVLVPSRLEAIGMLEGTVMLEASVGYARPIVRLEGATKGDVLVVLWLLGWNPGVRR